VNLSRLLSRHADNLDPSSTASRFRRARFQHFADLLRALPAPVRILDVGGTASFWHMHRDMLPAQVQVTLLNQIFETRSDAGWIRHVEGDGRWMTMFARDEFDVCFSNSVLEHVGTLYDQVYMAREIRRVARAYFVETPNKWFPLEPHFLVPCWQFLPSWARARMLMRTDIGCVGQVQDYLLAKATVESIRLLTARELRWLFPEAQLLHEKFGPFTKSLIAIRK
jgi:Methyltransferase domain